MLVVGTIGLVIWFFFWNRKRLDRDRDQHHLASMLVSVAAGQDQVSREDIAAHLRDRGYPPAQRQVRLDHAVKLAGTAVSGETYDAVVALARSFPG